MVLAISANNGKEASFQARWTPRVKHHQKDAVLSCDEINHDEYLNIIANNSSDLYFFCKSKQEQKMLVDNIDSKIIEENKTIIEKKQKKNNFRKMKFFAKMNKNLFNMINLEILEWYENKDLMNRQIFYPM